MYAPTDPAFPGTDDDRCIAEVDAQIKIENLRGALATVAMCLANLAAVYAAVEANSVEKTQWN